ncbi:uncharacterized protein LOC111328017 [Stylophora pistillata]|uniref:Cell death specification protein 2 n=1 Tax=Stylophora pistillata TaxID=50429 RepID=A0A2B4T2D8_STYPI|nr:uncharacterized protein LOC111328017 [Stylophora pistillata]PFX34942.1 Cell death specification protein 2 [Stylophora pistillata]
METHMETNEDTGTKPWTLNSCRLFDEVPNDILESLQDTESQIDAKDEEFILDLRLLDELNTKPTESLLDLCESPGCMDDPFFEQYLDIDKLFPDLPHLDTMDLGFEVEHTLPVSTSDICQSDIVKMETARTAEYSDVASPGSDVIDIVSLGSESEVFSSAGDFTDTALSPESVVDVVSLEEDCDNLLSSMHQLTSDSNGEEMADTAVEEITVIQSSDALTLLTQELVQSFVSTEPVAVPLSVQNVDSSSENISTVTVDIGELFSLSDDLGQVPNVSLLSVGDVCTVSHKSGMNVQHNQTRKRVHSADGCKSLAKKVKQYSDKETEHNKVMGIASTLDKQTVRRLKNNIASKHARAARRQKEQDLFQQEEELEKSNAELRKQAQELEQLTTMLRKTLVEKLSGITCPA